jgi:hypothetical protein
VAAQGNRQTARLLRWVGFAIVLVAMVAGAVNLVFAPWGNDPDGLLFGTRGLGYVDRFSYTFRDLDPMSRYYFSGGGAVLVAGIAVLAVTAGVRAKWSRGIAVGLATIVVLLFLAAGWGRYVSAGDSSVREDVPSDLRIAGAMMLGLAVLVAVAALALLFGARTFYSGVSVVLLLGLAVLHLWSMYALSQHPESEVRLAVLAWTPAGWYALGAVGALLATIAAALRPPAAATRSQPVPWPQPYGATGSAWRGP